jgi:hypothetical protein
LLLFRYLKVLFSPKTYIYTNEIDHGTALSCDMFYLPRLAGSQRLQQHCNNNINWGFPLKVLSPRDLKNTSKVWCEHCTSQKNKILKKIIGHRAEFDDVMSKLGSLNTWFHPHHHPSLFGGSWCPYAFAGETYLLIFYVLQYNHTLLHLKGFLDSCRSYLSFLDFKNRKSEFRCKITRYRKSLSNPARYANYKTSERKISPIFPQNRKDTKFPFAAAPSCTC